MSKLPECTLCGKKVDALNKIELEGTIVSVCDNCVKFGRAVEARLYRPMARKIQLAELVDNNTMLATDYGARVKKARETKDLTRTEFARMINERESVIKRIEAQSMQPDDKLLKKLEQFFDIKLKEKYEDWGNLEKELQK